ncbi:DMT family transporter [Bradyrhizobium diazoefficiens]|uniref:Putative permease of the drug/metabolite transporter n=1 Tax=Bradyrhizobium diazoefficiens SEMIA 5080 TaxID=754504 RepID=A0A837C1R5_9BRAD|nr:MULTISPECIES: DMT family transporter [Bradyrhizobium]APO56005.1 multidrug DMT transporter permease [Bradyrhizobium diazoefficiens]KGJ63424.1 putative permease of the drug/metabolite transporter [Bradyrhizobium diazoefficiens SEMIA 5080]KOY05514.1 multidrug DMT transporter permease [Bradyrhizobium diazoefficiens]MCD9291409.1 DMT family transporter [Bradyrhizobium diazoefficiens]MCD9809687.1 DMT family transporter [Bradyrhizobium diazoefficiens]
MTTASPAPPASNPASWLNNQPYLLLSLSSLFWAGNIVLARHVGAHVPPLTVTTIRWFGVFLILLPFAWPHLKRDWRALRKSLPLMLFLSLVGFAFNNAISYWALQYTEALNALLIQSAGPLFVALWSLALFGVRLTAAQLAGIAISLLGVLTIILRGDLSALASISFNRGDIMFASSLVAFGLYSAFIPRRPKVHQLSFLSFTTCCGAIMLLPTAVWEAWSGNVMQFDGVTLATFGYILIFPSTLAYLFFNRGVALIGPNRAAPFFHLVPVFGSAMAILLLGEKLQPFHLIGYALVLAGVVIASRQGAAVK